MMKIDEGTVATIKFSKTIQKAQYEPEIVEVTVAVNDHGNIEATLDNIREMAYRHLGVGDRFAPAGRVADTTEKMLKEAFPEEEKPKRKRRTKAEMQAAKEAEEAAQLEAMAADDEAKDAAEDEAAPLIVGEEKIVIDQETSKEAEVISIPELAKYATAAAAKATAKEVNALLKDRFGVSMLGKIKEEDRAEAVAILKVIIDE